MRPRVVLRVVGVALAAGACGADPQGGGILGYAVEDIGFATGISVGPQFDGVVFIDSTSPSRVFR